MLLRKKLFPGMLMLHKSTSVENQTEIIETIRRFYNISTTYKEEEEENWSNILSDRYFTHGTYKAVRLHASVGHHPIYNYHFGYKGIWSMTNAVTLKNYGKFHYRLFIRFFITYTV
ncbi:hypothetical protein C0J52_28292 [Blattella germanica]|nr:hypothetical protein C0J52_28292 [Blattella germanica]